MQNSVLAELKLLLVEDDPVPGIEVQEPADLEEVCGDIRGPHGSVIHASDMVLELAGDGVQPLIVAVSTDKVALCRYLVVVPTPLGQKRCIVPVLWVKAE